LHRILLSNGSSCLKFLRVRIGVMNTGKINRRLAILAVWSTCKCRNVMANALIFRENLCYRRRPRDALRQSKSCQLMHKCIGITCTTNPQQIEVMELGHYGRRTCNYMCLRPTGDIQTPKLHQIAYSSSARPLLCLAR